MLFRSPATQRRGTTLGWFFPPPCKAAPRVSSPCPAPQHPRPRQPAQRSPHPPRCFLLISSGVHHALCALSLRCYCALHPEYCSLPILKASPNHPSWPETILASEMPPLTTVCRDICPCPSPPPDPLLLQGQSSCRRFCGVNSNPAPDSGAQHLLGERTSGR